jgi:hypothetical protein
MTADTIVRSSHRDPDHISLAEPTIGLCFVVGLATLFNFYLQHVGFWRSAADPQSFTPLLAPSFARFLPWLNTYWLWAFGLCVAHLALRRWTPVTRLLDLALDLFGAAICFAMFRDAPFLQVPVATTAARWALAVVGVACLLGALDQFGRLLRGLQRRLQAGDIATSA